MLGDQMENRFRELAWQAAEQCDLSTRQCIEQGLLFVVSAHAAWHNLDEAGCKLLHEELNAAILRINEMTMRAATQ